MGRTGARARRGAAPALAALVVSVALPAAVAGATSAGAGAPPPPEPVATGEATASPIATPLSTEGGEIVDAHGDPVVLAGVNWFGFETETNVVHGLWQRDLREVMAQIADLGYTTIRLPWSIESLEDSSIGFVTTANGANAELVGATPLEAMDVVVDAAADEGLLVLLDNHRLDDDAIPELWYDGTYSEQDWIDAWTMLAQRYADQWNVVGADLKNEPHGAATWGTGELATDWRLAAERGGNAILEVAPHWLIVVEGIGGSVEGQQLPGHWWGGNLEGVRSWPVELDDPDQLVYSPHEYGPGVFDQPWFHADDVAATLLDRWEKGFAYIAEEGIAPILVGEFGGREVGLDTVEGRWQNQLVDFLADRGYSWTYWSWNPNSTDTGGILTDDWTTVHADKQAMLDRLIAAAADPDPPPTPTFADVPADHPFFADVEWMAAQGISTGYPDGTYQPAAPVSRQAMSAFLYRLAGEPPFEAPGEASFADVPVGHPFFAEVEWMSAEGITGGYADGGFHPSAPVSRQAMSAFLFRVAGEPPFEAPGEASFADVPVGHPFFAEVEWMAAEEITGGYADGGFHPAAVVSRQAMSAFLHRLADGPGVDV